MYFVHTHENPGEAIAAIATPLGEGGVAIIRISGTNALDVAANVFSGPVHSYKSHTAHYGKILNAKGEKVDDVLILVFRAPRSYTGENTVEIHCHGGSIITRKVLETVLAAGARAAAPGEFTFRAFINGKLDLAQAEAVQEVICAKNERALDAAEAHLEGRLSTKVKEFQHTLTHIAAILEAWVDFPEEGIEFATMDEIIQSLQDAALSMQKLLDTFHDGRIVHEGLSLCLIGCPNVGKSSLMNALLERSRAIVSDIPGTTRDLVEDHMRISGLNFKLVDTAGIRETSEVIEQEGIRRSRHALEKADVALLVLDSSRELHQDDLHLIELAQGKNTIAVWNKTDLSSQYIQTLPFNLSIQVSAVSGKGIEELKKLIDQAVWERGPPDKDEILITNIRHKEALDASIEACLAVAEGLQNGVSPEFLAIDMRTALISLGRIIGTDITEDVLTAIFSKFCIGK
ncbi:MAG: tRNA uridine-5-carboxymethylaminomethyl(34) synthesis GTPase MnmE [Parachlamydiales bacterium]